MNRYFITRRGILFISNNINFFFVLEDDGEDNDPHFFPMKYV